MVAPEVAPVSSVEAAPVAPEPPGGELSAYIGELRRKSCPAGAAAAPGEAVEVIAHPVTLGRFGVRRQSAGLLTFVAGYQLESSDDRFGGLSGLAVEDDGDLLAVSDQGDFVRFEMSADGLTPLRARIGGMRGADGGELRGKADGDAEGLALVDGVALVSFERNHRVLAFDLETCGMEARGAAVADGPSGSLGAAFDRAGLAVGDNSGPEPLAVTPDWYVFVGTETKAGARGPLSARPIEASPEFDLAVEDGAPAFVGMDLIADDDQVRAFTLHRGFDSLTGNAIVISETVFERYLDQSNLPARIISEFDERSHFRYRAVSTRRLAELGAALNNVDNFEGIAVRARSDGGVRIYIMSDDNFSERQRTLLMAFDLAEQE